MEQIYHISHTDLDGVGCHVVAGWFVHPYHHYKIQVEYSELARTLRELSRNMGDKDFVLITDLSPTTDEAIEALKELPRDRVSFVDHHKTSSVVLEHIEDAHLDVSVSATELLYKKLSGPGLNAIPENFKFTHPSIAKNPRAQQDFVKLVSDYDLWRHEDHRSTRLNNLYRALGPMFYERFSRDAAFGERPSETALINLLQRMQEEYVARALEAVDLVPLEEGRVYARVFAEQHLSKLGNDILEKFPEAEFVEMINLQQMRVELRSRIGGVDVSKIARARGGGGHHSAAGHPLKGELILLQEL